MIYSSHLTVISSERSELLIDSSHLTVISSERSELLEAVVIMLLYSQVCRFSFKSSCSFDFQGVFNGKP